MVPDIRKKLNHFFMKELWEMDTGSLGKYKSLLVKILRLLNVAFHELQNGQLTLRAMGLVYFTLFSIVPVLAISFSVLKAFGVHNEAEPYLREFLAPLGSKGEEITSMIIGFVENMRAGVLGSAGFVVLLYTVISVIQKIEEAFNYIWRVKRPRTFIRQFSDYISIALISPVLMFSAMGITVSFMSSTVMKYITSVGPFGFAFYYLFKILPFVIICGVFTFIYILLPNTKVRFRPAMTGGIIAGILWEIAGWGFASFVVTSLRYEVVYSGFAVLILFMMWLYLSWLVLLIGAQLSFYHQYPHIFAVKKGTLFLSGRLRMKIAFLIMYYAGHNFLNGRKPFTVDSLVEQLNLPVDVIQEVIIHLEQNNLLLETGDDPPAYIPARDIRKIRQKEIFDAAMTVDRDALFSIERKMLPVTGVEDIINRLEAASNDTLGEKTLEDVVTGER
ncbi:MAG: YihY/virulence factor BrkB family protein [Nitrospiraceae bacterium]|nr:MAG: YihY/virulence factor BrkB family protein [Nitrospiraceae bacterium]